MGRQDEIYRVLQYLQNEGIRATPDFVKDILKLVQTNVKSFSKQIFRDFTRKDFENYNRFEKLTLTKKQKIAIEGSILWRYEYRNTSNLKCIFIVKKENNSDIPILLCAFNEDETKKKGNDSYAYNIERAIEIIKRISSEEV